MGEMEQKIIGPYIGLRLSYDKAISDFANKMAQEFEWPKSVYSRFNDAVNMLYDEVNLRDPIRREHLADFGINSAQCKHALEIMDLLDSIWSDFGDDISEYEMMKDPRWNQIIESAKSYLENSDYSLQDLAKMANDDIENNPL